LFFSVNNRADDRRDGVLWVMSYESWVHDISDEQHELWQSEAVPFLPAQFTPRLTAQEGTFISYPLPNHQKRLKPLDQLVQRDLSSLKLTVPAASKDRLRWELETLGIQSRLLFPDLEGVARSIKLTELQS
jgi:hypothetical protein